jgi:hypothetical protein
MTTKTTAMTNTPHPSPYTGDNPSLPKTADELRARIPGWGADLTPVFGTSCPPKGLSGKIRRLAYARYSEARAAHWLLLLAASRVGTVESTLGSFLSGHPDNVLAETGAHAEFTHGGLSSRLGHKRADVVHHPLDPLVVLGPWVLAGAAGVALARRAMGRRTST